jgi:hypothetical protein
MLIEEKKKNISNKLSNLFVEKYDFFKDIIEKINNIFDKYNIDFQYDYNTFCKEYIDKCILIIDDNPDIDLENNDYFIVYGVISASMIIDKKLTNKND